MVQMTVEFFNALLCQHVTENPTNLIPPSSQAIDAKLFFQLIDEHRLIFVVLSLLKHIPVILEPDLKKMGMQKGRHQLILIKHLLTLTALFKAADILHVVLKGVPLNQQLYGDAMYRVSRDIDFLINAADLVKAHHCLIEAGYVLKFPMGIQQLQQCQNLLSVMKDLVYRHPQDLTVVELHWNVMQMATMNFVTLKANSSYPAVLIHKQSILVLPAEENFLYLCLHAAFHNWERLVWLVDIAKFYQKMNLDWSRLVFLVQQYHCVRPLLEAKFLLKEKFALELPNLIFSQCDLWAVKLRLYHAHRVWKAKTQLIARPAPLQHDREVFFYILLLPKLKQKWSYIAGLFLQGEQGLQQFIEKPTRKKSKIILVSICRKVFKFFSRL